MSNCRFAWLRRPGIGRRIALTMILSLTAVQGQALLQVWLLSDPEIRLVGARWLAQTSAEAARATFALPAPERQDYLARWPYLSLAHIAWRTDRPTHTPSDDTRLLAGRVSATIRASLGRDARDVFISSTRLQYNVPIETMRITFDPRTIAGELVDRAFEIDEPESPIPATLVVAIQGPDETWLTIAPVAYASGSYRSLPWGPLTVAAIIITLVSAMLAQRIVAPLQKLVEAANRIGTTRELVRVPSDGMHEFASVANAFEDMQRKLLRFVDDRTTMLAAISHDLRSALTRMRLDLESFPDGSARTELMAEIEEMQSMVEATLAFAQDEARLSPTQNVDLATLMISIVDEATDAGKVSAYQGPDHLETVGHPVSLKRAIRNLVDNAIKYGGCAHVALSADENAIYVTVEDQGPGIPVHAQEDVFRPFLRLDPARSHRVPGAGLGLTIARDVVLSHGGSISLANREAGGLRVTITLPRVPAAPSATE